MVLAMAKTRSCFRCTTCGASEPRWNGRCSACGDWNTLEEEVAAPGEANAVGPAPGSTALPIAEVDAGSLALLEVGLPEVDRVLGGGLVPGSVTLLGGEPGVGKSTLLLQAATSLAERGHRVLYVAAEESAAQVRRRASRLGALSGRLWLVSETSVPSVLHHVGSVGPEVVIVDSVQSVHEPELTSAPGSVTQVRAAAQRFVRMAKERGVATVLVGHVTKDGSLAGPRVLEHVVDTVLSFEGDRHHALRLLRAVKHRFGSTHEVGVLAMVESGLEAVADPSGQFLADRQVHVAGSAVVPTVDGRRPLLVEVQALVVDGGPSPRRSVQGLDPGRLDVLLGVLDRRVGVPVARSDVYALAAGGIRVTEPGADLAVALAVVSSRTDVPLPPTLVACGEIGLGGELRQVGQLERRLAEAARLGFTHAVVPRSSPEVDCGLEVLRVPTVRAAVDLAGLNGTRAAAASPSAV